MGTHSYRREVPRHVAYFVNQYPAVSHTFIRREIEELEALGWQVARFSIRHGEGLVDARDLAERERTSALLPLRFGAFIRAGLEAVAHPVRSLRALRVTAQMAARSDQGFFRAMFVFVEALVLHRHLRAIEAAHVHGHFATNTTAVLRVVRALGGSGYSFTTHGSHDLEDPVVWCVREKVHESRFVVVISEYGRGQALGVVSDEDQPKVHMIRCGLSFRGAPTAPPPSAPRLVCVARMSQEKGHLLLVRAAAQLASAGVPFALTLIGDGPLRPEIEREIERAGLGASIELTGSVDGSRVERALLDSRALVLPSLSEGLPVVLMECFRAQRPAIATAVGAISELVSPGVTGWLVPPGDVSALSAAMADALSQSDARIIEMGRAAFAAVRERHDIGSSARALSALFERALKDCDAERSTV